MARLPRLAALWTLLLHVFVAGALPLAHAGAEAASRRAEARVHVEAPDNGNCLARHDDLGCQVCSLMRLGGQPPVRVELPAVVLADARPPLAAVARGVESGAAGRLHARAPPLA